MTTVLVTGASGFLGSHVVRDQLQRGAGVHVLVRTGTDERRLADLTGAYARVVADLRDGDALVRQLRAVAPDRVFHVAAATMHAGRSPAPDELVATNVGGTVTLLDTCRELGVEAFVNVGDAFEYGPGGGARTESSPCHPSSLDGICKLASSLYCSAVATADGVPVVTIRPFSIVGRDDDPRRLVPRLLAAAREEAPIALSDRRVNRDFVAVADVVELLALAADHASAVSGRVFNCGRGVGTTLEELVGTVGRVTGRSIDAAWGVFPVADHDLDHPVADAAAAAAALGWRPTWSLDAMIEDLWTGA